LRWRDSKGAVGDMCCVVSPRHLFVPHKCHPPLGKGGRQNDAASVGYGTEPSPRGEGVSGADGCGERIGKHYTPHTRPYGAPSPKGEGKIVRRMSDNLRTEL